MSTGGRGVCNWHGRQSHRVGDPHGIKLAAVVVTKRQRGTLYKNGLPHHVQVWDPEASANTTAAGLHHKHKSTPYLDLPLRGRVLATFVRGRQVFADGRDFPQEPCGALVLRQKR